MKNHPNNELIRERLIKLRKEKGWTQEQAGKAVGSSKGAWQQWELGTRIPSASTLTAISYAFNVSVRYVCCQTDDPTPSVLTIQESRLQTGDRDTIEAYLNLTEEEKTFVQNTIKFLRTHRHS